MGYSEENQTAFNFKPIYRLLALPLIGLGVVAFTTPPVNHARLNELVESYDGAPGLSESDAKEFANKSGHFWRDIKPYFEETGKVDYNSLSEHSLRTAFYRYKREETKKLEEISQ